VRKAVFIIIRLATPGVGLPESFCMNPWSVFSQSSLGIVTLGVGLLVSFHMVSRGFFGLDLEFCIDVGTIGVGFPASCLVVSLISFLICHLQSPSL
jgi:hypothetical protein